MILRKRDIRPLVKWCVGQFSYAAFVNQSYGSSLLVQWLRIHLPMQGMRVQSLDEELGSHMPRGNKTCATTKDPACHR